MKGYIRSTGNISPQHSFGEQPFLDSPVDHAGNRLSCIEPDYKAFIDPKPLRRMSRIIKMGVASAMECLREAGVQQPGAIVTGTAYGCLEDTGVFLTKMVEQREELLAPTAFIQSTHNTVGAQIALMLHCNAYNNVFVHGGLSFESALLDGLMLLQEGEASDVLVGGIDEITNASHAILSRFGLYKSAPGSSLNLFSGDTAGTIAGEGAAFFLLCAQPSGNDYAHIDGLHSFYKPAAMSGTEEEIQRFLSDNQLSAGDIDLVITGRNGDAKNDRIYDQLRVSVFQEKQLLNYKHLCGEYPTSVAFAVWMASHILRSGLVPDVLSVTPVSDKPVRRILIYNHFQDIHHSLLLLSAC
jgi:3-oxoacyl-[acyl-carrier-protein] synthase II